MQAASPVIPFGIESSLKFHRALIFPGYVPFVGIISGTVRVIGAVAAAIFFNIAAKITKTPSKQFDFDRAANIQNFMIGRGILEMIPFIGGSILYQQDNPPDNIKELYNALQKETNVTVKNWF